MRTYRFTYRISGFMYDPCLPSFDVHAKTLRVARKRAQIRLSEIVREERAGHWMVESRGPGTARPIWYPYQFIRGWVSRGFEVRRDRPRRVLTAQQIIARDTALHEGIAAFISPSIQMTIAEAPIMADLFAKVTYESAESDCMIPLVMPMARVDWPPRPSSCKGQRTCY